MTTDNEEIVRGVYEAGNRGDWDAAFSYADSEIEWETDARLPNAGIYRGREEIQGFFEDQAIPFEESIIETERFFVHGDRVVAFVNVRRRPRGSTAAVELRIGHLWTIRDGKLTRGQAFAERERALAAGGFADDSPRSP